MLSFFVSLGQIGKGLGFGLWSNPGDIANTSSLFEKIISNIIGFMTICGGLWFIFQFIVGAYGWMSSAGNQEAVGAAQKRITHAVTGLVIVVMAYAVISVIGMLLGIDILNPGITFGRINP